MNFLGSAQASRRKTRRVGVRQDEAARLQAHPRLQGAAAIWVLLGLNLAWAAVMQQFESGAVYWIVGPYAVCVALLLMVTHGPALRARLVPRLEHLAIGVGVGIGMTLLTYPAYWLAISVYPGLETQVADLYAASHQESRFVEIVWVTAILAAEELLWRGAWLETLLPRVGKTPAALIAVALYGLAQLGSGSWIVCVLALICGLLWTLLRFATGSLWTPLMAHAIWTPVVILLVPLA